MANPHVQLSQHRNSTIDAPMFNKTVVSSDNSLEPTTPAPDEADMTS